MEQAPSGSTRENLLQAACATFAERGWRATVQEICAAAGANIAAVNYHFGGKANLYLEVWETLFHNVEAHWRAWDEASDPKKKLDRMIRLRVESALSSGPEAWFSRLVHWEMARPSPVHAEIHERFMEPLRQRFFGLVREVLGANVSESCLMPAAFCIQSPLIHLSEILREGRGPGDKRRRLLEDSERLIEGMQRFAWGGLQELCRTKETAS